MISNHARSRMRGLSLLAILIMWTLAATPTAANGNPDEESQKPGTQSKHPAFPDRPADVDARSWAQLEVAVEEAKLLPRPSGIGSMDGQFGYSVSVDGSRALVGGITLVSSGAVLVLSNTGSGWQQDAVLLPADGELHVQFGISVSLSGDRALVGAYRDEDNGQESGSAYVFDFDGSSWHETAKISPGDGDSGDLFGWSVSLSGERALVGAYGDDVSGRRSGSAYVFDFDGSGWNETAKLTPTDAAEDAFFGQSVSVSGNRALVGASGDAHNGFGSGSAYVFDFDNSSWSETAKLTPGDGSENDRFGHSVSLAGDRVLVGAYNDDVNGDWSGSAYVFDFNGMSWNETAKLAPADGAEGDSFGFSVSLSGDRALVGAYRDDPNGTDSGSAYVFDFNGTVWRETDKLSPSDGAADDSFGRSVSLSGDRALVGAHEDDDNGTESGSAYVFDIDGSSWSETAKLTAAGSSSQDRFGVSVSLYGDQALVGAYGDDDNGGFSGSAYLFDFDGSSWSETAKLAPADGAAGDFFGRSVSLSEGRALIGAYRDDHDGIRSGSAYVFDFNGTSWSETAKLTPSDGATDGFFGWSVSLSGDRALIGAFQDDDKGTHSGSAYIFDLIGPIWSETAKLTASDGATDDSFGVSVSLSEDRALIGAYRDDDNGTDSGSAYIFDLIGTNWIETAKLAPGDGAADDSFGRSVSLAGDRALVGAYLEDGMGFASGSAYVFDFDDSGWSETAKLKPTESSGNNHRFGISVGLSGNRALVGAYRDDDNGTRSGSAYVFDFDDSNWSETAKLMPADGSGYDNFGYSVSLSGDRALVGALFNDDNGTDSGSAYVFRVNHPPIARPDELATEEDSSLNGNVLSHNGNGIDQDADGDVLAVTEINGAAGNVGAQVTLASGALVTLSASGSFVYDPNGQFESLEAGDTASDAFEYTISDGVASDSATVTVTINGLSRIFADSFEN
jgi:VCBS repeat-containing protein